MIIVIFDLLYNADAHFVCLSQSDHYVLSLVSVCLSLTFYPHFLEGSVSLHVCHILSSFLERSACLSVRHVLPLFFSLVFVCLSLTF